jgi:biopolymer transport protein ExbD
MRQGLLDSFFEPVGSLEMTPILDVVFLLIIFFLLVFQFLAVESVDVQVPDSIRSAQAYGEEPMTVTVGRDKQGRIFFRVNDVRLEGVGKKEIPAAISSLIDRQPASKEGRKKIVRLRCDREVPFGEAKYALQGIVRSSATDIQWSVMKQD